MRGATWNGYVGQEPDDLRHHLSQVLHELEHPEWLAGQEMHRLAGTLPGYERVSAPPSAHEDHQNNVLFVRKRGVKLLRRYLVKVGGPDWKGPKGDWHKPHWYPGAMLEVDGHKQIVLAAHMISNKDENPAAAEAQWRALDRWVQGRKGGRPLCIAADWNSHADSHDIKEFAHENRLDIHLAGIDGILSRGYRITSLHPLHSRFGSDHHRPVGIKLGGIK